MLRLRACLLPDRRSYRGPIIRPRALEIAQAMVTGTWTETEAAVRGRASAMTIVTATETAIWIEIEEENRRRGIGRSLRRNGDGGTEAENGTGIDTRTGRVIRAYVHRSVATAHHRLAVRLDWALISSVPDHASATEFVFVSMRHFTTSALPSRSPMTCLRSSDILQPIVSCQELVRAAYLSTFTAVCPIIVLVLVSPFAYIMLF